MTNLNPRRCVLGCYTKGVILHDFPHPNKFPQQFKRWVEIVGEPVKNLTTEEIHRKKKVCHIHFIEKDWNRNNRLNALAIPSLHIPALATSRKVVHHDHNYSEFDETTYQLVMETTPDRCDNAANALSSTSCSQLKTAAIPICRAVHEDHNYCGLYQGSNTLKTAASPDTSDTLTAAITVEPLPFKDITNLPPTSRSTPEKRIFKKTNRKCKENVTKDKNPVPAAPQRAKKACSKKSRETPDLQIRSYKDSQRSIKNLRREIIRLRKRSKLFKDRLQDAEKLCNNISFRNVTKGMTVAAKLFTEMQFRQTGKKAKGRRFSLKQKILSLSLYKRSPKGYRLLTKCFTLPSPKTLKKLLSKIKLESGINKLILKKIKQTTSLMKTEDKLCTLIFDEMHITPQIKYDIGKDEIKGFTTHGSNEIADHALVFMVKGIRKTFKQPVAYYFTQCLKKDELKAVLQEVVKNVSDAGLNILCTICDQSSVNVSTINSLIDDTKKDFLKQGKAWKADLFCIGKKQIIPLYDVPHLVKGIRNNLLTKDLKFKHFEDQNKEKIIKWRYFQELYEADKSYGELKYLHKITEEHVDPNKINKMRVKPAAQILSHSVAVAAEHITERGALAPECKNIIPFVLLIDKLFDSLNVNTFLPQNGKIYKEAVKRNSPHHKLWQEAIIFFREVRYLTLRKQGAKTRLVETLVPTIKNFIKTIEGFQQLWVILHHKYGFDSMLTRNFNQDPIENFFGSIRSLGARNVSPDCVGFVGAYKSLLLNNYCSRHSIRANCEEDVNTWLQTLDFFINENEPMQRDIANPHFNMDAISMCDLAVPTEGSYQRNYVCGWVLRKCFKKIIRICQICKDNITINGANMESNSYILAKEYYKDRQLLVYPSQDVVQCFYHIQNIITNYIKSNVAKTNIKQDIKILTDIFATYPFNCEIHKEKLRNYFEDQVINVIVCSWCRSINRILSGKITFDGDDQIKTRAQLYHNKRKHIKNKK